MNTSSDLSGLLRPYHCFLPPSFGQGEEGFGEWGCVVRRRFGTLQAPCLADALGHWPNSIAPKNKNDIDCEKFEIKVSKVKFHT